MKITITDEINAMERELCRLEEQNSDYIGYNFPNKEMEELHYLAMKSVLIRLYKLTRDMLKSGELVLINGVVTEKLMY